MKFLFAFVAFSASMIATTMAGVGYQNTGYGASYDAPVGLLHSQRILPTHNAGYAAPAVGYGAPAVAYAAPAVGYGIGHNAGYANDAQVHSLAKLALSLPTPAPDTVNCGRGYGSSCASHHSSY